MEIKVIQSGSSGNAIVLEDSGEQVLMEAGVSWRRIQKFLDFDTSRIRFCLCSHSHGDHSKYINAVMRAGVECFGPISFYRVPGLFLPTYRFSAVPETVVGQSECSPFWYITSFPCVHDVPCVGYAVEHGSSRVVYVPDTLYSPVRFGKGVTHFLLSVNYSSQTLSVDFPYREHVVSDHMSLETAIELLKANDLSTCREIHLLHLSDSNSNEELFKSEVERLTGIPTYVH
jgi:phosphoribosyl 1,2-cyclic phosphodiesterase